MANIVLTAKDGPKLTLVTQAGPTLVLKDATKAPTLVLNGGLSGAAGAGVPRGGTANQVLAKTNGTDYSTQWVDQNGGVTPTGTIASGNIPKFNSTTGTVIADSGISAATLSSQITDLYASKSPKLPTYTVGAAGDFTTIQAALDAATNGGTIYLIDNSYTITSTLLIKSSDVTIIGNGAKTVISCNGATVTTLIKANSTTYARFKLKNVELYQSNATVQGIAIDGSNMALCVYEGLVIANFGTAVKLNDTVNLTFYNRFADIFITGCNNGIDITSTNPVNDNMFMNIRTSLVAGGAGKGLKITKGQSNNFYNCNFESGAGTGITGISLEPTVFGDVYDTNFYGVYVEGNATNVSINSNTVRTNFFGGQIVAGLTADVVDTGSNTQFWGADVGYALKNQLSAMSWLDATSTSATLISLKNNTSFAHIGGNLVKAQMLNGTDTSNVIRIENAGTGKSISGTNGTTETFSVDKAGAILSAGVAVPTISSTSTLTNKTISGASNTLSAIGVSSLSATGTPSSTTYLRGDNTWATVAGGGSGINRSVATISANTSAGSTASTDYVYICTGSTGYTLTLPTAVGNTNRYTVKNGSTANQTLATTSAQTVDGSASATLTPNTSLDLISDGTNWRTI